MKRMEKTIIGFRDYDLGTLHGNLFALVADKFPLLVLRDIMQEFSVIMDFKVKVRVSLLNNGIGYFVTYPDDRYDEIKRILDKIYEKFEPTPDYPNIYNLNKLNGYPSIFHRTPGQVVIWFKRNVGGELTK